MGYADSAQVAKRQSVTTRKQTRILVKLIGFIGFGGLEIRKKDVEARNAALLAECEQRGIDPAVYGRQVDTGLQVINNARMIFFDALIEDLRIYWADEVGGMVKIKIEGIL